MQKPVTVILTQPVSVTTPPKSLASPDVWISSLGVLVSLGAVVCTYIVARTQKRMQESLRDIQKQKLALDLYERRMKVYFASKKLLDFSLQNRKPEETAYLEEYYAAYNESRFLFDEEMVNYLLELYTKASDLKQTEELLAANQTSHDSVKQNIITNLQGIRKWLVSQHEIGGTKTIPPIVEKFKKYLDFSNIRG